MNFYEAREKYWQALDKFRAGELTPAQFRRRRSYIRRRFNVYIRQQKKAELIRQLEQEQAR